MKLFLYDHYLKVEGRATRGPPPVCGEGVVSPFVRDQKLPAENEHMALSEYFGDLYPYFDCLKSLIFRITSMHFSILYYNFPTNSDT